MNTEKILKLLEQASQQIETARSMIEAESVRPPPEALKKAENGICLSCNEKYDEGKEKIVRGLHASCWNVINKQIKQGKLSEELLISGGKLLLPQPGGRKAKAVPYDVLRVGELKVAEPRPEETKPDPATPPKKHKRIPK